MAEEKDRYTITKIPTQTEEIIFDKKTGKGLTLIEIYCKILNFIEDQEKK